MSSEKIISVTGATGTQGSSVVDNLLKLGGFTVRAITRNADSDQAKALASRGVQIVEADLTKPETLESALDGSYGLYLVTNAWDPSAFSFDEYDQGKAAVEMAKSAGVEHVIWSTLPNCKAISNGRYEVAHFTNKALVDSHVKAAGFRYHTFVEAPMYFQNLTGVMAPVVEEDGSKTWRFAMDPSKKCIHNGDISELGALVAQAFENPEKVGNGTYLAMTAGLISWQEIVDTLNGQGHKLNYVRVPDDVFDSFPIPGAAELRQMMSFWEEYTYFGPAAASMISNATELYPDGFTSFSVWAKENMKP